MSKISFIKDYKIVVASTIDKLETDVKEDYLFTGWEPIGGLIVLNHQDNILFAQTMILRVNI